MRKLKLIVGLISLSALSLSNAATTSAPMQVTATVEASCNITTGNINFGSIQLGTPSGTTIQAATNFLADCAEGVNYSVSWDGGLHLNGTTRRLKHSSSNDYIEYELDLGDQAGVGINSGTLPGTGDGIGNNSDRQIFANIWTTQNAKPGAYSDTVTVTITY